MTVQSRIFTLGVASHNVDNRPATLAAIVVTMLLLVRLKIELDIKHDEEEHSLERKIQRIQQINTMASVSMIVGLMALVRQMASGEITSPFLN
jgi:archaellum biogenesis protein FlaJ (TadC family)